MMWRNTPETDRTAPHGRSRINLRKMQDGAGDFTSVLTIEKLLFFPLSTAPTVALRLAFKPTVTLPPLAQLQPAVQFAQATFDIWINLPDLIDQIAIYLEPIHGWFYKYPIGLPMLVSLKQQLILEVAEP